MICRPVVGTQQNSFAKISASRGFTLIELVIVLAVIGILLLMAVPSVGGRVTRQQINESLDLIKPQKLKLADQYAVTHDFPPDFKTAEFPRPLKWIGNYVERIDYQAGVFTLHFGQKAHAQIAHKKLSIRPLTVVGSPESPISWSCGNSKIPKGMQVIGLNETDIGPAFLPYGCF